MINLTCLILENLIPLFCSTLVYMILIGKLNSIVLQINSLIQYKENKNGFFLLKIIQLFLFLIGSYYSFCPKNNKINENNSFEIFSNQNLITKGDIENDSLFEMNLYQRKSFIYLSYVILLFVVEIFCEIYLKIIKLQNSKNVLELEENILRKVVGLDL